jgi:hypothetical protein
MRGRGLTFVAREQDGHPRSDDTARQLADILDVVSGLSNHSLIAGSFPSQQVVSPLSDGKQCFLHL